MQIQKDQSGDLEIKTKSAIVVFDHKLKVNDLELEGAGEYEAGGISVQGIDDNTYIFQIEEVTLGFISFKGKISKEDAEKLSNAEVLIVRLDGNIREAVEQVGQIEPKTVIYAGGAEAKGDLKKNGVSFKEETPIKITKSEAEAEEAAFFLEISNGDI
jgi:hypothetical protein